MGLPKFKSELVDACDAGDKKLGDVNVAARVVPTLLEAPGVFGLFAAAVLMLLILLMLMGVFAFELLFSWLEEVEYLDDDNAPPD
jgi:hypothetical protein